MMEHNRRAVIRYSLGIFNRPYRMVKRIVSHESAYNDSPPIFVNSFPKSGTNLLFQMLKTLPGIKNYYTILVSRHRSNLKMRFQGSQERLIRSIIPGEIAHGHIGYSDQNAQSFRDINCVHFFIYRDLRDVVISTVYYLAHLNIWHCLHGYYSKKLKSDYERITTTISGIDDPKVKVEFNNIRERFEEFRGWLGKKDVFVVKFEDLISERREETLNRMAQYCANFSHKWKDADYLVEQFIYNMNPSRSHTFRRGEAGVWREQFSQEHCDLMKDIAGDLLVELGYEEDLQW